MAISVTNIGTVTTSGSVAGTISATVPSGALIFVCCHDAGNPASPSVTDASFNTYTKSAGQALNNLAADGASFGFYVQSATALSSQNITCTPTSAGAGFSAFYATGLATACYDSTVFAKASGSSNAPSVTAANAPAVANSLIVASASWTTAASVFTQDSTNAAYTTPPTGITLNGQNIGGGHVVSSSKLTYAPTLSTGNPPWAALIFGFKPSPNASVTLTGVEATSAVGTITPSASTTPSGVEATGSVASFGGTFSRASPATYQDASGNYLYVGNDVLRPLYTAGVFSDYLIETASTNPIRNPRGAGAVVGTPGSLGTHWGLNLASTALSTSVVSVGTDSGIDYVGIRFFGTAATSTIVAVAFEPTTVIAALTGQTWTSACFVKLAGGSTSGLTVLPAIQVNEYTNVGGFIQFSTGTPVTPTSSWQRISFTKTLNGGATVAFMDPSVSFRPTLNAVIDMTLYYGWPSAEQRSSVSSPIVPPLGTQAATTRAADTSTAGIDVIGAIITGVAGTGSAGTTTSQINPTISGINATGAVGTPTIEGDASTTPSGVEATGAVGTPTVEGDASITLTGVAATSAIGTPTIEGDVSTTVTGVEAISAVGTPTIEGDASITTGVEATGAVGDLTVEGDASITLAGVAATSAIGALTIEGDASTTVTGVEAISAVGTITAEEGASITLVGVEATGAVGDLTVEGDASAVVTGVATSSAVGTITVAVSVTIAGVSASSAVAALTAPVKIPLTGVSSTTAIGIVTIEGESADVFGVQASAVVSYVNVVTGPNQTNVAITGVAITGSVGFPTPANSPSISLSSAPEAQVGVVSAVIYSSGLIMTDLTAEAVLQLSDDFDVTLRWSDTSGYSWSDSAIRSIGATGQYLTNPQWRRLGMSRRGRVWELSWSCPQATALQGATVMFVDASS